MRLIIYDLPRSQRRLNPAIYELECHALQIKGVDYSSGVYYYKLTTDDFSETGKMVLIK